MKLAPRVPRAAVYARALVQGVVPCDEPETDGARRQLDPHHAARRLVVIRDAGHLSNLEQSGAFNAALSRFYMHY
jgi:pimeloyl-ACP methyl ester carboxylesterase